MTNSRVEAQIGATRTTKRRAKGRRIVRQITASNYVGVQQLIQTHRDHTKMDLVGNMADPGTHKKMKTERPKKTLPKTTQHRAKRESQKDTGKNQGIKQE